MKAELWPKRRRALSSMFAATETMWNYVQSRLLPLQKSDFVMMGHASVLSVCRPGKEIRLLDSGEHIHIFPRMLVFVSGAEKSHIMPVNSILVQMSHSELPTSIRRCFAYQFRLPSIKTYYDVTRERLYIHKPWVAPSCLSENENLHQKVMEGQDVELVWCNFNPRAIWILPKCSKF